MKKAKHIIIGYSGHACVVIEALLSLGADIIGYTEKVEKEKNPYALLFLGSEQENNFPYWNQQHEFVLGIGDNAIRAKIFKYVEDKTEKIATVIHAKSVVSRTADIQQGTVIMGNATINALTSVGKGCIINTGAIIEHECSVGDFAHIAPGAVLAGNVSVGSHSFVGANAVVKQGVQIGHHVIIGAGSVVLRDVPDNTKIVGNPGRIL